jgi:type II secretory pathway predicted ATPase ExeA/cell division septation protein DedD
MYLDFFVLQEKPFSLTPDPRFLFLSDSHRQALDHMVYGIQEREGFILVAGDIGTGKTTICRELLERLDDNVATALILNPLLSEQELLEAIVEDFALGMKPAVPTESGTEKSNRKLFDSLDEETQNALELNPLMPGERVLRNILEKVQQPSSAGSRPTKKELIDRLNQYLLELVERGGNAVLIIDEAQNLPPEVLEQVRILSNLETTKQKLLQIVLVGQLELKRKLESPALRQLNQRITIRYQLNPLTYEETKRYVEHRLFVAGSNSSVTFDEGAYEQIYDYSRGVPRLVNLICERSLLAGYVDQARKFGADMVLRCRESLEGNIEAGAGTKIPARPEESVSVASQTGERPDEWPEKERPGEAVDQPWERKKRGLLSGMWRNVAIGLMVVAAIAAVSMLTWKIAIRQSAAPVQSAAENSARSEQQQASPRTAAPVELPAVRLAFSLQLGAFRNIEDALEQARLFGEQGLDRELYVVPLHVAQLGGRWYRLFYGGFPSSDACRTELSRLVERGLLRQGSARVVETSLAYNLGDFGDQADAEKKGGEYMRSWRIPSYAMILHKGEQAGTWRLYAGAFENRDQAAFLGDRIDEAGLGKLLVERLGYWPLN